MFVPWSDRNAKRWLYEILHFKLHLLTHVYILVNLVRDVFLIPVIVMCWALIGVNVTLNSTVSEVCSWVRWIGQMYCGTGLCPQWAKLGWESFILFTNVLRLFYFMPETWSVERDWSTKIGLLCKSFSAPHVERNRWRPRPVRKWHESTVTTFAPDWLGQRRQQHHALNLWNTDTTFAVQNHHMKQYACMHSAQNLYIFFL